MEIVPNAPQADVTRHANAVDFGEPLIEPHKT
jgi:hypothetical protein